MKSHLSLLSLIGMLFGCCERSEQSPPGSPGPPVTRAAVLELAEVYLTHRWRASDANRFHGIDAAGIRVDTPDDGFVPEADRRGWWTTEGWNEGLPYQWGGFSTPEEFDRGLLGGKFAGDVYSAEKRRLLDDAVSAQAVGVDCSGFVSRCWRLPRSYSTRELPNLCEKLADFAELKPGDILNTHNGHVVLFAEWLDAEKQALWAYEAGSVPERKVLRREILLGELRERGFEAYRYRNIRD